MSFRFWQLAASRATELFRRLFSRAFGCVFGKVGSTCTSFEMRKPNEIPNRTETARGRLSWRSWPPRPPLTSVHEVVRCSPIPRSQRLDRGIGEHLQLEGPGAGGGVAKNQPGQDRNRLGQDSSEKDQFR